MSTLTIRSNRSISGANVSSSHCFHSILIRLFKLFLLFCSILSGILFAVVWRNYEQAVLRIANLHSPLSQQIPRENFPINSARWQHQSRLSDRLQSAQTYKQWLRENQLESVRIRHEDLSFDSNRTRQEFTIESEFLWNRTKVFCMILSSTRTRSRALNNTWTKHCNQRWFYGGHHEMKIKQYTKLKLLDDSLLSPRTFCLGFIDLLNRVQEDFQWLMIVTDQTYAIVDNLRYLVTPLDSQDRFYIGRPVHHYFLGVYNAFDSGIVLSRGTVDLLANTIFVNNRSWCVHLPTNGMVYGGQFDSYIGMYLNKHGILPENTFDDDAIGGGSRFHPFMPEKHIKPNMISVFDSYWSSNLLPVIDGYSCCSNHAITFTGFSPVTMYFIEYILYHLAPFTDFDGPRGLGNSPPPYESYQVQSDFDLENSTYFTPSTGLKEPEHSTTLQSNHHHHHHHYHHHRRKRKKHRT